MLAQHDFRTLQLCYSNIIESIVTTHKHVGKCNDLDYTKAVK